MEGTALATPPAFEDLEGHRRSSPPTATGCSARRSRPRTPCRRRYPSLAGYERFEGRAALRSWLYRIATNVCIDMLNGRERRASPMDLGPTQAPGGADREICPRPPGSSRFPTRSSPRTAIRPTLRVARDDPPRVRCRIAASATAPAGRADPLRGPALEGRRGRGAPGHERGLRQQRAAAGARDARYRQGRRRRPRRADEPTASCSPATWTPSSATTWRR